LRVDLSAEDFYLSPAGDDRASGRDPDHPWKSWKRIENRTVLRPGNRVRLLDGTYASSDVGFLEVDCSASSGENGTPTNPVTIEALHERRAFVKGDGSRRVIWFRNCSYYRVEGLHVESDDNARFPLAHGIVEFTGTESRPATGDVLRRNLFARNNRYANSHLIQLDHTQGALVEENELYYFHRLGIALYHAAGTTVRRNYVNSRGHASLPNGRSSGGSRPGGGESFSCYPCSGGLFENNISEGSNEGFTVNSSAPSSGNTYYGNVSLDEVEGFRPNARGDEAAKMPVDTRLSNDVAIGVTSVGIYSRAAKNTSVDHVSIFPAGDKAMGIVADSYNAPGHRGDGLSSLAVRDSIIVAIPAAAYGFRIESPSGYGRLDWSLDNVRAFGSRINFAPKADDARARKAAASDPGFGACRLWCPDGAACKGAASDGGDLGATVLYKYQDGALTKEPLWDASTGAFLGAGAIVAGLNDVPGASLFDIATRLNVNRNGCAFPAGYGPAAGAAAPAPTPGP
jgi:hypothetical protein